MPLRKAKCTNCGASLQVDVEKKAAICPYCNQAYIVEEAINNYTVIVENLHADTVTVNNDTSAAARLKAGNELLMVKEWEKADAAFEQVCTLTPGDHLGWWGRIRAKTHDFTSFQQDIDMSSLREGEKRIEELERLYKGVNQFVPADKKSSYKKTFDDYIERCNRNLVTAKKTNALCRPRIARRIEIERARSKALSEQMQRLTAKDRNDEGIDFFDGLRIFGTLGIGAFVSVIWLLADWYFAVIPKVVLGAIVVISILLIAERVGIRRARKKQPEVNQQLEHCHHLIQVLSKAQKMLEDEEKTRYYYNISSEEAARVLKEVEQEVRTVG